MLPRVAGDRPGHRFLRTGLAVYGRFTMAAGCPDARFVPALFRQWGPVVTELADIKPGDAVLDVACGTGTLTLVRAMSASGTP